MAKNDVPRRSGLGNLEFASWMKLSELERHITLMIERAQQATHEKDHFPINTLGHIAFTMLDELKKRHGEDAPIFMTTWNGSPYITFPGLQDGVLIAPAPAANEIKQ